MKKIHTKNDLVTHCASAISLVKSNKTFKGPSEVIGVQRRCLAHDELLLTQILISF